MQLEEVEACQLTSKRAILHFVHPIGLLQLLDIYKEPAQERSVALLGSHLVVNVAMLCDAHSVDLQDL